eukprot:TRINITY_DN2031_c0_g1_i2.p1 TRINITY_DN2031_c0_g1~~TRINITY_DN2031_c0_g1_i2.p1  ORF type:complete len:218 (+),score=-0.39 TRINITY_DN2031_c0_g1_i2:15-668(+)
MDQAKGYVRKAYHFSQIDFEYTLWQMFYLCIKPKSVYNTTRFHKQTKNQWARDDPSFVMITMYMILITSISYAIAFSHGLSSIIKTVLWTVFVDYLLVGLIVATFSWYVTNKYMRLNRMNSIEQKVEWLYAFDIHCNSFFPMYVLVHVVQYFALFIIISDNFLATVLSNIIYCTGLVYYFYVTFLGYTGFKIFKTNTSTPLLRQNKNIPSSHCPNRN